MTEAVVVDGGGHVSTTGAVRRTPSPMRDFSGACRAFDIIIALLAIAFTAPLLIAVAAGVFLTDGASPVFAHKRIGRGGRVFRCLKFRSMVVDAEARMAALLASDPVARCDWERDRKLRRDPRITRVGDFLRRSSLDELPQLFNVLAGEMSIVGPRPIVSDEVARYGARFATYCRVRPGITGLWQVSGRNDTTYRRRVALDTVYARNKCLTLDVKIVMMTIPAVLFARGSY